ncbi:hypothetical protein E5K00_01770 [Hymenobacter aquaticus]|uniref:TonB C-terminal domain-containing protein n=1 Tax=Hymenobacter aquaticus TaxID=1867101 RepID=A0A4Z0Q1N5_9BACT|nr:hypothetical protein [Hymenobacter aquaticus]TGE23968.1 hypothetical protein E5K00_01770 [Hymenobacter aquaticus]
MRRSLLFPLMILCATAGPLVAQSGAGVHSAPGMPLSVGHKVRTPYSPARVLAPVVLPRSWHLTDPAARRAASFKVVSYLTQRMRWPKEALQLMSAADTAIQVQFVFQLRINADGSILPPRLLQRNFALEESRFSPTVVAALEKEANRIVSTMRFSPATLPRDSIAVPLTYSFK